MERPTSGGRRHVRAGSVPVHDLITREIPRIVDPPPAERAPAPAGRLDTVLEPTARASTHRRAPSKGAQVAKLTGLGVAAFLLCGAVTAGSMIAGKRPVERAGPSAPAVEITGEQALLPDRLNETLPPSGAVAPRQDSASTQVSPTDPTDTAADDPGDARSADDTQSPQSPHPDLPGPLTDAQLVEHFYELLPTAPAEAFAMLSPDLLDSDLREFLHSWSTVSRLEVLDLVDRGDGVLAVVRMRLADGGTLRVQQLLSVAERSRQIVSVELLSAQRN